jgi:exocyst complex component 1
MDNPRGLESIEATLVLLYKAMMTMDPKLLESDVGRPIEGGSILSSNLARPAANEVGSMRAVQERKDQYRNDIIEFLRRLKKQLDFYIQAAMKDAESARKEEHERNGEFRRGGKPRLDSMWHEKARRQLVRFGALMLFTREVDHLEWEEMLRSYERPAKGLYQEEFREFVIAWQRMARKATAEDHEVLFTAQEKDSDGIAVAATRKLTVKRSQTLAKMRHPVSDDPRRSGEQPGKLHAFEAFSHCLDEMANIMFQEQNFVVDFFHISSMERMDFSDIVGSSAPYERQLADIRERRMADPDKQLSQRLTDMMGEIYAFFPGDVQKLVDWTIKTGGELAGIGVLLALETQMAKYEETNQDFLLRTLQKVHDRLANLFSRFVDGQIRAIEDKKVKIKKRKGVITFMKIFPIFSTVIENMLPSQQEVAAGPYGDLEVRVMVDQAYGRINKAMFESLRAIAKESPAIMNPGQGGPQLQGDIEAKEALNYHILLIENMNHYVEEVDARNTYVLEDWKQRAHTELEEHLQLYIVSVIRRPLGKLLVLIHCSFSS